MALTEALKDGAMVHNPSTHPPNSCQICANRETDLSEPHGPSPSVPLFILVLHFKTVLTPNSPLSASIPHSPVYVALQQTLTSITSNAETIYHPTQFTCWSPAIDDGSTVVILTTAAEEVITADSPIFTPLTKFLAKPPSLSSFKFDHSIVSLAANSPRPSIALDIILLHAPTSSVAVEVGKKFGWDPKRSSLVDVINQTEPGTNFPRLGDLVRDFFAWADWTSEEASSSNSAKADTKSGDPSAKGLTLNDANSHDKKAEIEQETLLMMFQWSSISNGDRFKNPDLKSQGANGREIPEDFWNQRIAHPVKELQDIGARVETFRVELRGVECVEYVEPVEEKEKRTTRTSRRLSAMASGIGERVSGLWR